MFKLNNWVPKEEFNKPIFNLGVKYEFSVVSITEGTYSTGTPKLDLILNIWKENGAQVPFKTSLYYGGEKPWQLYSLFKCIGADIVWDKLKTEGIDLQTLKNRTGLLIFEEENYTGKDGNKKTILKPKYLDKKEYVNSPVESPSEPFQEDDIPWSL